MRIQISKIDRNIMITLIQSGRDEEAFQYLYSKYIQPNTQELTQAIQRQMRLGLNTILTEVEINRITLTITSQVQATNTAVESVFTSFTKEIYTPRLFKRIRVTNPLIRDNIVNQTLAEFANKTRGALSMTNSDVLSAIRTYQRDLIKANLKISSKENIPGVLNTEVNKFKRQMETWLRKNNPDFFKQLDEGKFIRSRPLPDGTVKHYKLNEYSEMSVRTTLMNVQRTSVEVASLAEGARVVGYDLIDNRPLKGEEREICQEILGNKVHGESILALDDEVAKVLGIMTVDEAKSLGAMGVNCRHGLIQLDTEYLVQVEKVLMLEGLSQTTVPEVSDVIPE